LGYPPKKGREDRFLRGWQARENTSFSAFQAEDEHIHLSEPREALVDLRYLFSFLQDAIKDL
jgi:hypothetical protein